MAKVSVIIPSRNETYLRQTVEDVLKHATGEIEILVAFDGPPYTALPDDPRVIPLYRDYSGLKPCVNAMAALATGTYLFKSDAHCAYSEGFDQVLAKDHQENDITVPRFYTLHAEDWTLQDRIAYDHFYLSCPLTDRKGYRFQAGGYWPERTQARLDIPIDETMQFQGASWFVTRDFFLNKLGGMSSEGYGNMFMEPPELGLKTWLGPWGGRVVVNKKAWGAHAHKGKERPRGYGISMREVKRSYGWTANYWMRNTWQDRAHDLAWLVEKFAPIPGWPSNWQELELEYERTHPWP